MVFDGFQVFHFHHDARFLPLLDLVAYRRFKDVRVPLCKRGLYYDLFVFWIAMSILLMISVAIDNGTGAPAGWNWILSL